MKKILALLLAVALCFTLIACGSYIIETTEITTEPKKLSDDCSAILSEGISDNGDVYELVANETEDYTGTEIEIGVIKNNEWLIEPTTTCPLLNENGFIINNYSVSQYLDEHTNSIKYIGNGCFYCREYMYLDDDSHIIWNVNTNKMYTTTKGTIVLYDDFINDEGKFIFEARYKGRAFVVDTNTMTETNLKDPISTAAREYKDGYVEYTPYSEGLYCITKYEGIYTSGFNRFEEGIVGFYDLAGNLIIDMSEYAIVSNNVMDENLNNFSFKDGKCSLKVKNDQGSYYMITIDKAGEVLENYKIS